MTENWEVTDSKLMRQTLRVMGAAIKFKAKVLRDSPDCFVPSKELQELFDALEDMENNDES